MHVTYRHDRPITFPFCGFCVKRVRNKLCKEYRAEGHGFDM
jgi:hypothetical protein